MYIDNVVKILLDLSIYIVLLYSILLYHRYE